MEVKINREIRNYTESMFFGLSLRQFVFSLLAVGVAVLLYFVLKPYVGTETVSWMCILGAAPFAAMGFVNYNDVSLPVSMFGKGDFYILRAKGDSMVDAGIDEDDLLVIERNCPALEGDIVVALDEDNQNTLKRYAGYDEDSGYYILEYENEEQYPGKTIKLRSFQVQGVARHVIKSL